MSDQKQPNYATGKICYIAIPAVNAELSAAFYKNVFNWAIQKRGNGSITFSDSVNQVGGIWAPGVKPMTEAGLLIYLMVADAAATIKLIEANGCKIIQDIGADAPEITARFSDPAGNVLGIYQQAGLV